MTFVERRIHMDGEPYSFNTETQEKYGESEGALPSQPDPVEKWRSQVAKSIDR